MFRRIVVGMSGGIDSSVSAALLKNHPQKFDVIGVFMKNWDERDEFGKCNSDQDFEDAQSVCEKLKIPLHQVNFVKQYWNEVFDDFLKDYQNGITPNPDILCNRKIKFNAFFNYAMKTFDADAFATGHYAKTSFGAFLENYKENRDVRLLCATDTFKDQTFFLSQVNQKALRRTMFPVGGLLKSEVKKIAQDLGFTKITQKRESMGVCFIGRRNFQKFISEYIDDRPGDFVDFDTGAIVGQHEGYHKWTIGQRCQLGGQPKPYFVMNKDIKSGRIYVVQGTDHPCLFTDSVHAFDPSWIREIPKDEEPFMCQFRFQHTKPLTKCKVFQVNERKLFVKLEKPLRAITPGQYAVFYKDSEECIGSARILSPGPSLVFS